MIRNVLIRRLMAITQREGGWERRVESFIKYLIVPICKLVKWLGLFQKDH
jgi:hypothetical protein